MSNIKLDYIFIKAFRCLTFEIEFEEEDWLQFEKKLLKKSSRHSRQRISLSVSYKSRKNNDRR
ncbi:hypothetical protein BDE36_1254 [Arcticibacter tournemirensis]|nr:hypothetical protein BDE36_1254 [Arcticibacter tournemirensis]